MNMLKVKRAPYIAESENVYKKINKKLSNLAIQQCL